MLEFQEVSHWFIIQLIKIKSATLQFLQQNDVNSTLRSSRFGIPRTTAFIVTLNQWVSRNQLSPTSLSWASTDHDYVSRYDKPTDYHSDNTCSHIHNTKIEGPRQLLHSETQHSDQLGTHTCITTKTIQIPHNQLRKFDNEITPLNKPHQNTTCCRKLMVPRSSQKPRCSLSF